MLPQILALSGRKVPGRSAAGVEELVADVGENGGPTRGDAAFGDEDEETGEELADVYTGVEFGKLGE
jgi:hypothetical protein